MSVHKTALLSAVITALFASGTLQAAETLKAVGNGEGQLDIVAWPGYIERGESDKAYDWVTGFEKETGCKVNVKTAATSDEMVSLMTKGGYDLVTASGDASLRLVAGKRVQPINTDLIPGWKTLDPRLKDGPWYTVNKQTYGTPYQWGPNVLMYNTDVFKTPPVSWSVVFEPQDLPDGKPNKGRVQAYDGPIYIADAALYLKTKKPELKIEDPYQLTETQYKAVLDLLRAQHPLVHRYWHDATVQMSDVKNEGVARIQFVGLHGQRSGGRQTAGGFDHPPGRRHRLGRHYHAACRRQASELRLQVDGLVAATESPGRRRRLVRLAAGGACGVQGQ
jgi:putative spermidine/putrescine transport system substrate-binding protein